MIFPILLLAAHHADFQDRYTPSRKSARSSPVTAANAKVAAMCQLQPKIVVSMEIDSRYEIGEKLGKGGMGVVFRARDRRLERDVAIKFILPESDADPEHKRRFNHEWKAYSLLKHPGIVDIIDRGEFESRPYIVMEYLDGDTLEALLKKGAITKSQWLAILRQMASALDFAHRKSLVHRDVKPANVMVAKDGIAKIMDFGIVKAGISGFTQTATGMQVGSPSYMAPEQLLGHAITGATDQWALAIVAYEGLTGNKPFRAESEIALANQICTVPVPASSALNSAAFSAIRKGLSKKAGDRYPNCLSFVQELEQAVSPATAPVRKILPLYFAAPILLTLIIAGWFFKDAFHNRTGDTPVKSEQPVVSPPSKSEQPVTSLPPKIEQPTALPPTKKEQPATKLDSVKVLRKAGDIKINPKDGLRYVWIPPGTFRMGCSEGDSLCESSERPAHEVTLTRGYWLGESEVTQQAYRRVVGRNPSEIKGENLPVESVSWNDANRYCGEIGGRLPTEA